MIIREELENREEVFLSPFAAKSGKSKGRSVPEEECDMRTAFQRDRDRILHCRAFRRLKQKTQVFLLPEGDHYRTRLTHTLEVAQIARTIAKTLNLNEELVEAIALAHDLGHTPFGHAGERALNRMSHFSHAEQGVRVVEKLEKSGKGLNLTWEVKDGILNHQTSGSPYTLEGQIVRLSDKFAYIHHDIDDAVRGGILTEEDIPDSFREVLGMTSKLRLNTMIRDVIANSMGQPEIRMSEEIRKATFELRSFMFINIYSNPKAKGEEDKAVHMVEQLYEYYIKHPEKLPEQYLNWVESSGDTLEQAVCAYIAGMSDTYAVRKFNEIYVPGAWVV